MTRENEDTALFKVVVNHQGQYSILPAAGKIPVGWTDAGKTAIKSECLEYIKRTWTDMTPISLRKQPEGGTKSGATESAPVGT